MKKIAVIGAINMDIYLEVENTPDDGETVVATSSGKAYGGKGSNAAIATKKLGLDTSYYGCVGNDDYGRELLNNLDKMGIDTKNVSVKDDVATGTAYIALNSSGDNSIIAAPGGNQSITREDIRENCYDMIEEADLVLIQLEISREGVLEIINICNELGKTLVLDTAPAKGWTAEEFKSVDYISPNEGELADLLGRELTTKEEIIEGAREVVDMGIHNVVVTLGNKGSIYVGENGEVIEQDSYTVDVVDTTAAGDSFISGFSKGLLDGLNMKDSMDLGNKCGAIAVTKKGASPSMPSSDDIENFEKFLDS